MDTRVLNEQRFEELTYRLSCVSATLHNVSLSLHQRSNILPDPSGLRGYVGMPGPRGLRGPVGGNGDESGSQDEQIDPVEELMQLAEHLTGRLLQQVKILNDLDIVKEQYSIKK